MNFLRKIAPALAILASVALFANAFPPHHERSLAWIALVPFLVVVRTRHRPGSAALAAGAWGMLAAWSTTDWLPPALASYYHQPYWLGFSIFATAAFLMGAIEYMGFALAYFAVGRTGSRWIPLTAGAAWSLAEYGRDVLLTGNPWGLLGYSQMPLPMVSAGVGEWLATRVVQVADLGGVYAVGFVLVAANTGVAEEVLRRSRSVKAATSPSQAPAPTCLPASLAVLAFALLYGEYRLNEAVRQGDPRRVLLVQANLDLGSQWDPAFYGLHLREHLERTALSLRDAPADLVIWPENAMTFFVDREPAYRQSIAMVLSASAVPLLSGAPRHSEDAPTRYYNSAVLMLPGGEIEAIYDKQHLLPFAEYFPFGSEGFLHRNFGKVREFSPGDRSAPISSRAGRLGVLICNEAMFPQLARERVSDGAELLVNLSNDSWVGSPKFAENQLSIASMRAVEQRRYLVRSSTWGPSAIVDPLGRVQARTATDTATVLRGTASARDDLTVFHHASNPFLVACALWLAWSARRGSRNRRKV